VALVLARKKDERIYIPSIDMTITVIRITGDVVRLAVDAPKDVVILRSEVPNRDEAVNLFAEIARHRKEKHDLRGVLQGAQTGFTLVEMLLQKGHDQQAVINALQQVKWTFAQSHVNPSNPTPVQGPIRALLVEDHPNEREMLASILRMSGYEVVSASSGEDAINYLGQAAIKPDVMLLDMGLPNMKGDEVIRTVRLDPDSGDMKIFVISGSEKRNDFSDRSVVSEASRPHGAFGKPECFAESRLGGQGTQSQGRVRRLDATRPRIDH
jgi:two-component system cell cycle response regulator DivK